MFAMAIFDKNSGQGFTVIEMVVAITITVLIASLVIGNVSISRFQLALIRSANRLALDLHRVESDSLASREFKTSGVPNAWGMHFYGPGSTRYTVFADLDSDNMRALDGSEDLEESNFEPGVLITSSNITDVVFVPPDPTITFTPAMTSGSLVLSAVVGTLSRTITINKFGAITVQ